MHADKYSGNANQAPPEFPNRIDAPLFDTPSNLELKIRKKVMDALDEMVDKLHHPEVSMHRMRTLSYTIKDRLNLLWGD